MNAADVRLDGRWETAGSAVACVADVSIDGGAPMPMMGLLAADGELVIPVDWDDPPVADGVAHVIRIELRPPCIRLGPGRVASVLEGCHAWRLGYGKARVVPGSADPGREAAHVVVAAAVPRSVRATAGEADSGPRHGFPWWASSPWLCAGATLAGFVIAWLIIRQGLRSPDRR